MMADKKIQMTQRNSANDGWDNLYPRTTGDQVTSSDGTTTFDKHLADNTTHIPYKVATGSANIYAVTLSPAPTAYIDGMGVCVKINVASTGASTLNVNGLGAKPIKDSLGNPITSGGLKANTPYTLRYESTSGSFILQGKGGGGNASTGDLLSGKTATVDTGQITGAMPNNGAVTITPSANNQTIVAGYHNGSGYVKGDANLVAENISNGKIIFGITGIAASRRSWNTLNPPDDNFKYLIDGAAHIKKSDGQYMYCAIESYDDSGLSLYKFDLTGALIWSKDITLTIDHSVNLGGIYYDGQKYIVLTSLAGGYYRADVYDNTGTKILTNSTLVSGNIVGEINGIYVSVGEKLDDRGNYYLVLRFYDSNLNLVKTVSASSALAKMEFYFNTDVGYIFINTKSKKCYLAQTRGGSLQALVYEDVYNKNAIPAYNYTLSNIFMNCVD